VKVAPMMVRMLLVVAVPLALGCSGEARSAGTQQAGSPMNGAVAKAEFVVDTSTEQLPLELPAQLYAEHDAVVVARSAGTIDSIFAELGDRVRAGQLLARLESGEQELALASAEAAHDNFVRTAARARELARSRSLAPSDSEQVELQLRQAVIARREAARVFHAVRRWALPRATWTSR